MPNQEQKTLLDKHFGCILYVFNHFLNERKEQYQVDKKSDNVLDRDLNAAKNILKEGLKILNSAGTVENTGGGSNKTSAKKHKSVKPEAHPIAFGVGG